MGLLAVALNARLRGTAVLFVCSLMAPYLAFAAAEAAGASGILAVVVAGFVASWRLDLIAAESRVDLYGAWDLLTFMLNALMFLFVGLEIPRRLGPDPAAIVRVAGTVARHRRGRRPGAPGVVLAGGLHPALALSAPAGQGRRLSRSARRDPRQLVRRARRDLAGRGARPAADAAGRHALSRPRRDRGGGPGDDRRHPHRPGLDSRPPGALAAAAERPDDRGRDPQGARGDARRRAGAARRVLQRGKMSGRGHPVSRRDGRSAGRAARARRERAHPGHSTSGRLARRAASGLAGRIRGAASAARRRPRSTTAITRSCSSRSTASTPTCGPEGGSALAAAGVAAGVCDRLGAASAIPSVVCGPSRAARRRPEGGLDRQGIGALPRHRLAGRGRHGRGVPGDRHPARPRGRDQGPAAGLHRGSRAPGPLRARSEGAGAAASPEHRLHLRARAGRRRAGAGHGARRGTDARRPAGERAHRPRGMPDHRPPDRRGARGGARQGHRPPRPQAGQHQAPRRRQVKVLDFGLAKALDTAGSASAADSRLADVHELAHRDRRAARSSA